MLPPRPQPLADLRRQYPTAILQRWDSLDVLLPGSDKAGLHPEHIFDTVDGWRIIISRDFDPTSNTEFIHFSGSWWPDSPCPIRSLKETEKIIVRKFLEISDISEDKIVFAMVSPMGIPHWVIPLRG